MDLILHGNAKPSMFLTRELLLDEAFGACTHFDQREEPSTTVIMHSKAD
jgi:hypothetical protein